MTEELLMLHEDSTRPDAARPVSALEGHSLMPREIADIGRDHWKDYELTKMVATTLGESAGYIGAYHDNLDGAGDVASRDCGLMQDNIVARLIGTDTEMSLRTTSTDRDEYLPVARSNIDWGFGLYSAAWKRDGKTDIRRWQPWVAYTTGWATFPEWWVWQQKDGQPVGPWVPTGRYIQRAIAGQMNRHIIIVRDWEPSDGLHYAKMYAQHFGVTQGEPVISNGLVAWKVPPKPTADPADGVGPRPKLNNGV